jgi:hypothetical protein
MVTRSSLALLPLLLAGCNFDTSTQAIRVDARERPGPDSPGSIQDANNGGGADARPGPDAAPSIEIRLNINGNAHSGIDYPGAWQADPGSGGACGPFYFTENNPVNGTLDDALFYDVAYGDPLVCSVGGGGLPSGAYRLRLFFAEFRYGTGCPQGGGSNSRLFDIDVEGTRVRSNVNLYDLAGCTNTPQGHPHIESFDIQINDGTLSISMPASIDFAMVSAIELVSLF